ncbi:hypothetical protein [Pseudodesulfovibrio sp.]|uniref:hypothetical protein n=1 Tax=unclassified Pseudodesulfovibrio TaxID=2661612 RepID=UPI003AFFF54A
MSKLVYGLLTADLIVDRDSGSTSYIRTVEHAVVPEFPTVLPPIFFASLWDLEGKSEPFMVSLSLVGPGGVSKVLGEQEVTPGETLLHKMNFQLPGLKVEGEGRHAITAAVKQGNEWVTVAELPLYVFQAAKG